MSKIAARIYDRFFADTKRTHRRSGYAAARPSRTQADWTTFPTGANWNLYRDLRRLRARAREMAKNAPHFRKFLMMASSNVIGPDGIMLRAQVEFGTKAILKADVNKQIEDAFWEWGHRETCTATGKLDWAASQRLFVEHLIRDGEVLVQHIKSDNPFGYSLKFWNVDWLDETFTQVHPPTGNRIIMSVEIDANDKPVAYWLTTPSSEINFTLKRERQRTRIDASEMTHAYIVLDDESQVRGVTWFHAALLAGKDFHEYVNNVNQQARVGAASLGFLEKEINDEAGYDGREADDGTAANPVIDVAPLSMNELPPGYKLTQFDPKQPTQNHAAFSGNMLMYIAAGLGPCGFSLSGDMSAVNYSSGRMGLREEREVWRFLQKFVANTFCREVFHRWLHAAQMSGKLSLSAANYQQALNPAWQPRGWQMVDPQKEITGNIDGLANNLLSLTDVLADQGIDPETHFKKIKAERELAAKYGIDLVYKSRITETDTGPTDTAGDIEEKPPADAKKKAAAGG